MGGEQQARRRLPAVYSGYLDSLLNHTIERHMQQWMPIGVTWLSSYPDLFALGITLFLAVMLAIGVKESTRFNNIFTGLNLLVVVYVVIAGSFKADITNWRLKPQDVSEHHGKGGFFPYGIGGMLNGAASCFYAFVGFDCIATMGEEVRNPRRAIPIGIVLSLGIVFLAYFGWSIIETLLWPYYDQNVSAPLPFVFQMVGWPVAKWIISIGALAGLSTSLLGAMFPLPRVLYAMGSDGLIFRFLATVHPRLRTPLIAPPSRASFPVSEVFEKRGARGVMAMMFNVEELANMMSIGTLLAYSLVAVSVLMLRETKIDVFTAVEMLAISWQVTKREVITNCFRKGGIQKPRPSLHGELASDDEVSNEESTEPTAQVAESWKELVDHGGVGSDINLDNFISSDA
ncbi:hypothetical protein HPB48_026512 [Haemaphysalis longicornis]|uniref:Cationic amino acid transporter n=1 Tax=Haemaphysalis longicornis TaxID=44386 RepID=A0A9J6HCC8_HAELO|nr:hypothetical protein HPB48_026512 [Haemaphysalis longicornis]